MLRELYYDLPTKRDENPYHSDKPGRKFGGGDFQKRGFGGKSFGPPQLHKAKCAECGEMCEVPFKPNGKKPVLCSRCFKQDGAPGSKKPWERQPARFESSDRPRFSAPAERSEGGISQVQFKTLNAKLDKILEALTAAGITDEEE